VTPTKQTTLVLRPGAEQIVIEGTDIASSVQALDLHADARSGPQLQLHLSVGDLLVNGEANVTIADRDARALIALGWTPPGADG
jgi:hypothetical protein